MRRYLAVYNTLGFPSVDRFLTFVREIGNRGADFLEVGIPPRFAKYDGPTIRKSYSYVKNHSLVGVGIWEILKVTRKSVNIPLIALTYLDDWIDNLKTFAENLHALNIDYVLFPDLLIDYIDKHQDVVEELEKSGLKATLFVSPSMPDKFVEKVSPLSRPFLYYGLRPATGISIPVDPATLIKRVRSIVNNVLVVGFGLSLNDVAKVVEAGADGIAIGSAIVEALEKEGIEKALSIVEAVRGALDGL